MTQLRPPRTWSDVKPVRVTKIPEGLWMRCVSCDQMIYRKQMEANLHVCPLCEHHYRISASQRVFSSWTALVISTGLDHFLPSSRQDITSTLRSPTPNQQVRAKTSAELCSGIGVVT